MTRNNLFRYASSYVSCSELVNLCWYMLWLFCVHKVSFLGYDTVYICIKYQRFRQFHCLYLQCSPMYLWNVTSVRNTNLHSVIPPKARTFISTALRLQNIKRVPGLSAPTDVGIWTSIPHGHLSDRNYVNNLQNQRTKKACAPYGWWDQDGGDNGSASIIPHYDVPV